MEYGKLFEQCKPKYTKNCGKPHPKSQFSKIEDAKLSSLVEKYGENNWTAISRKMGNRNERQCKERWTKYLNPKISKAPWSKEEDKKLLSLYMSMPGKWMKMSKFFNNRTDASLKNRWNLLKRRYQSEISDINEINDEQKDIKVEDNPVLKVSSVKTDLLFDAFQEDFEDFKLF